MSPFPVEVSCFEKLGSKMYEKQNHESNELKIHYRSIEWLLNDSYFRELKTFLSLWILPRQLDGSY